MPNSRHQGFQSKLDETLRAAAALGMSSEIFDVRAADAFEPAFASRARAERVGVQAACIHEGADVSLMPVERPTHIRTAVDRGTAASIGISVPPAVIARAEEVIR